MPGTVAEKIIAECVIAFPSNNDDCNKYLKAVAAVFFEPDLFTGPHMNADGIIADIKASSDWTKLQTSHTNAIANAKDGQFVVAGMTSAELDDDHGHLAVVIGEDGQNSGTVLVPICYAGSLSPTARVQRKRVSETFGADPARQSLISYFARVPQTVPASAPLSRLMDFARGLREEPQVISMELAAAQFAAASSTESQAGFTETAEGLAKVSKRGDRKQQQDFKKARDKKSPSMKRK